MLNTSGIRVRKFNRTTWILNGDFDVLIDLGDEFSYTLTAAYSRLGNQQFNEYALKIAKNKMCDVINGQYKPPYSARRVG